ncbi:dihydropyrimidinase [Salinactinospora qingdaonensis]|uniref:Dihydropyrimidinase n=1 Tax=Salinactinospora qingdaonensis TaxID=702744 RepID=A0ABP7F9U5_9ACTN
MTTTLITGGTVVTAEGHTLADVRIDGERVTAVTAPGAAGPAARAVDATGHYLLPGGVDTHTHLEYPIDGFTTRTSDDFHTGTVAAAFGGTTTIVDFTKKEPDHSLYDSFQRRIEAGSRRCVVDFGLHAIAPPLEQQADALADLRRLAREGVSSWKFFMAYPGTQMVDDATLIHGMRLAADEGVLPMVHAENGHLVADAARRLVDAGHTSERHHHAAHSHISEGEAVHRAVAIAESVGSPLFTVHVSSRWAAEEIAAARARGLDVWGETCPQYLLAAYEDYDHDGPEAAAYLCSPPIRERANQEHLWRALATGALSTIGTDHAPFYLGQPDDLPPQKSRSTGYFPKVPNGVPGVEERLMVIHQAGVVEGRIDLRRFVDLTATRPAKLFGLYPRKGTIQAGADADIVVWDPAAEHTITAAGAHSRTDYTLYEGMRVTGRPRKVFSRGELIVDGDELHATPGRGRYLTRAAPDLA